MNKFQLKRLSTQKDKPIVKYEVLCGCLREGLPAIVYNVSKHPRQDVDLLHERDYLSGKGYVRTSRVIKVIRKGSALVKGLGQPTFETENTIYTPKKWDKPAAIDKQSERTFPSKVKR